MRGWLLGATYIDDSISTDRKYPSYEYATRNF